MNTLNSNPNTKLTTNILGHEVGIEALNQYQLIDMKQITQIIGMTDKWVYSLIKKQLFPKPIKLGRSSRWRLSEIETWINNQAIKC